jgi:GT2 family glycosyltransferase
MIKGQLISVICVYNNKNILKKELEVSVDNQRNVKYEKIFIDNRDKKFSSAAKALNYGVSISSGNILIFTHQDIILLENNVFEKLIEYFALLGKDSILGVAGKSSSFPSSTITNILHGKNREYAGKFGYKDNFKVNTIDECFFAITRESFHKLVFDENICFSWHLYGVEYCLEAKKKLDCNSFVVDLSIYHNSAGNRPPCPESCSYP